MISKDIQEYLKTEEGKKEFYSISESKNDQMSRDRMKSFLNPPENVKRWRRIYLNLKWLVDRKNKQKKILTQ